jgi:glycosyltransferase involved in cell wall biosynthesis
MHTPSISIIIPCYNVADFIRECISELMTGLEDAEVILVNNASTDNTAEVLEGLRSAYPCVQIFNEEKKGACAARNTGLRMASGVFVKFLDADDLVNGSQLLHQVYKLKESSADVLFSPYIKRKVNGIESLVYPLTDPWKGLFTTQLGLTSALMFRAEAVKNVQGWNATLSSSQEYDLLFRLFKANSRLQFSNDPAAIVREREAGQISTSSPIPRWKNYLNLRVQILDHLREQNSAYFAQESDFFYQAFFDVLHICYPHLPEETKELHSKYIKKNFSPKSSAACSGKFMLLYRLFGFGGAEKMKQLLGV